MTYAEYCKKCEEIEKAEEQMKLGKLSPEEYSKKYIGIPSETLPDDFTKQVFQMCDYHRKEFDLTSDGHLYEVDWTIFVDEPDKVYFVYDTTFHGEADCDYKVVEIPINVFSDKTKKEKFIQEKRNAYLIKERALKKAARRKGQASKFNIKYEKEIQAEESLRNEQDMWNKLRRIYLPKEFDWILDSLIQLGAFDDKNKSNYIQQLKNKLCTI